MTSNHHHDLLNMASRSSSRESNKDAKCSCCDEPFYVTSDNLWKEHTSCPSCHQKVLRACYSKFKADNNPCCLAANRHLTDTPAPATTHTVPDKDVDEQREQLAGETASRYNEPNDSLLTPHSSLLTPHSSLQQQ